MTLATCPSSFRQKLNAVSLNRTMLDAYPYVKLRISKSLEACSIPLGSLSELFDLAALLSAVDILDGLWCLSDNIYNYVVNIHVDIADLLQRH